MTERFNLLFMKTIISLVKMFPLWAILFSVFAYFFPSPFITASKIAPELIMFVMFALGMSINLGDFKRIKANRKAVIVCNLLHFTIMPITAFVLAKLLTLRPELLIGIIFIGSVASSTSSSVMIYFARGDIALSVTISIVSAFLGIILTPILTYCLAGGYVPLVFIDMLFSMITVAFIPMLLGIVVNHFLPKLVNKFERFYPLLSMLCTLVIIGSIVAGAQGYVLKISFTLIFAALLLSCIGFLGGYWGGRLFGLDESTCRTVSLQVGMQNSVISAGLALYYVSALAALPSVVYAIWQNIAGGLLAGYWRKKNIKKPGKKAPNAVKATI